MRVFGGVDVHSEVMRFNFLFGAVAANMLCDVCPVAQTICLTGVDQEKLSV